MQGGHNSTRAKTDLMFGQAVLPAKTSQFSTTNLRQALAWHVACFLQSHEPVALPPSILELSPGIHAAGSDACYGDSRGRGRGRLAADPSRVRNSSLADSR